MRAGDEAAVSEEKVAADDGDEAAVGEVEDVAADDGDEAAAGEVEDAAADDGDEAAVGEYEEMAADDGDDDVVMAVGTVWREDAEFVGRVPLRRDLRVGRSEYVMSRINVIN